MQITLDLSIFNDRTPGLIRVGRQVRGVDRKVSQKILLWFLEALVQANRIELRKVRLPPLYRAGVRYVREQGTENWQDCIKVFNRGYGDCEDLACWRVAELRNQGKKAQPYIRWRVNPENGMLIYHVMVMRPNGIEDPSKRLGMKGRD